MYCKIIFFDFRRVDRKCDCSTRLRLFRRWKPYGTYFWISYQNDITHYLCNTVLAENKTPVPCSVLRIYQITLHVTFDRFQNLRKRIEEDTLLIDIPRTFSGIFISTAENLLETLYRLGQGVFRPDSSRARSYIMVVYRIITDSNYNYCRMRNDIKFHYATNVIVGVSSIKRVRHFSIDNF